MRRSTPWPARGCWAGMGPRCRWWTWPACSTYRPLASREWPLWSGTATGRWAGASTRSRAKASRLGPEPADLVLSDVEMPGMDGFALTRTIRRTGGWEQVPVVIMTSRGADTDRHAGLESGACHLYTSEA